MEHDQNLTSRELTEERSDWAGLFARAVDDLGRIIQIELKLFQAGFDSLFSGAVDRLAAGLIVLSVLVAGELCFLAALVLFLHKWLELWQALAVTGAFLLLGGVVALSARRGRMKSSARFSA